MSSDDVEPFEVEVKTKTTAKPFKLPDRELEADASILENTMRQFQLEFLISTDSRFTPSTDDNGTSCRLAVATLKYPTRYGRYADPCVNAIKEVMEEVAPGEPFDVRAFLAQVPLTPTAEDLPDIFSHCKNTVQRTKLAFAHKTGLTSLQLQRDRTAAVQSSSEAQARQLKLADESAHEKKLRERAEKQAERGPANGTAVRRWFIKHVEAGNFGLEHAFNVMLACHDIPAERAMVFLEVATTSYAKAIGEFNAWLYTTQPHDYRQYTAAQVVDAPYFLLPLHAVRADTHLTDLYNQYNTDVMAAGEAPTGGAFSCRLPRVANFRSTERGGPKGGTMLFPVTQDEHGNPAVDLQHVADYFAHLEQWIQRVESGAGDLFNQVQSLAATARSQAPTSIREQANDDYQALKPWADFTKTVIDTVKAACRTGRARKARLEDEVRRLQARLDEQATRAPTGGGANEQMAARILELERKLDEKEAVIHALARARTSEPQASPPPYPGHVVVGSVPQNHSAPSNGPRGNQGGGRGGRPQQHFGGVQGQ